MMLRTSLITLLAGLPLAASNVTAAAADCSFTSLVDGSYKTVCPGQPGSTQSPAGPAGVPTPSCDLSTSLAPLSGEPLYCVGTRTCFDTTSGYLKPPDVATQPTPDTKWHVQDCLLPDGSWGGNTMWDAQAAQPPSRAVQAIEAIGHIVLPQATLVFNPTNRTLVNLDTWFWADGLKPNVLQGSSAFGLIAYATPSRLVVTPGDGSAARTCQWVMSKSSSCAHYYRRSSLGGPAVGPTGAPAYEATATAWWKLHFEDNGKPVIIPGALPEMHRDLGGVPVVVDEVQTIVTSAG
jgi:hypothetical protein